MATTEELIAAQKELRLDRITTKVLLRQPYRVGIPPSWEWDDMPNKYAAPVTAFTVDRGSVELWADSKTITWRPPAPDLRIKREAGQVLKVTYDPIRGIATVTGPLPATSTRLDTLALPNPDRSACLIFGREFAYTERVPTQKPDLVKAGPKLADITKECLVKSDNQIAEHLLLLAAERVGPLGKEPYKLASARLKAFLTDSCGLNGGDFRPDDGSGLSRHNLVTTRGLSQLLVWAMQQAWAPVWQGLLASPAQGTLKSRLPGSSFRGKTGTLDAVVALSGYVTTKGGETLVLSVIVNNSIVGDAATRKVVDQFAAAVEQLGTDIAYEPRREDPLSHSSHRALVADRLR